VGAARRRRRIRSLGVGVAVDPGVPDLFVDSGDEWLTFVSDNEDGILVSRLLLLIGDFLFILFLGTLRTRLSAVETEPRHWTAIAFGGGLLTAAMLIGTSTPVLAASSAADGLEPSAAQALGVLEYAFFIGAGIARRVAPCRDWHGRDSHGGPAHLARLGKSRHRPPDADHHRPYRVHRNRHRPPALGARCQHSALEEERHRFLIPVHRAA
jgi:hypothetical protein